jgi:hypothetical protein
MDSSPDDDKRSPEQEALYRSDQGETEDEEVKMTCIGGQYGMQDSDLSSDEDEDSDDSQDDLPAPIR